MKYKVIDIPNASSFEENPEVTVIRNENSSPGFRIKYHSAYREKTDTHRVYTYGIITFHYVYEYRWVCSDHLYSHFTEDDNDGWCDEDMIQIEDSKWVEKMTADSVYLQAQIAHPDKLRKTVINHYRLRIQEYGTFDILAVSFSVEEVREEIPLLRPYASRFEYWKDPERVKMIAGHNLAERLEPLPAVRRREILMRACVLAAGHLDLWDEKARETIATLTAYHSLAEAQLADLDKLVSTAGYDYYNLRETEAPETEWLPVFPKYQLMMAVQAILSSRVGDPTDERTVDLALGALLNILEDPSPIIAMIETGIAES